MKRRPDPLPEPEPEKMAYTVAEAAKRISISRSLMYEVVADKKIKVVRIGTKTIIPAGELETFLKSNAA